MVSFRRAVIGALASLCLMFPELTADAGTPLGAETIFTARWEMAGPGGFSLNDDPGWRMAPEDFDTGEEILIPDAARRGFQFFNRSTRKWREISVGTMRDRYIPWKAVRDGAGMIYYLPIPGLQESEVRVVSTRGGRIKTFGQGTIKGYARYIATDRTHQLAILDASNGLVLYSLEGNLIRRVEAGKDVRRHGIAYSPSSELITFCERGRHGMGEGIKRWVQFHARDGTPGREVPGPYLTWFVGVDRLGQVYSVDGEFRTVRVVTPEGQLKEDIPLPPTPDPTKDVIWDQSGAKITLRVDADGTLYQMLGLRKKGLLLRRFTRH